MTMFKNLKSMNIDEFVEWIDKHFNFDDAPYWKWWDENYCKKCEPIELEYPNPFGYHTGCAYCELNGNCEFFKDMDDIPDSKQVIKMWLRNEIKGEERECPDCKYFVGCSASCKGKICDLFIAE